MDCATLQQVERWLKADVSKSLPAGICSTRRLATLSGHARQPVGIDKTAALRVRIGAHRVWQTADDDNLGSSLDARLEAQIRRPRLVYAAPS